MDELMPIECLAQSSQPSQLSLSSSNVFGFKGEEMEAWGQGGTSLSSRLLGAQSCPFRPFAFPALPLNVQALSSF